MMMSQPSLVMRSPVTVAARFVSDCVSLTMNLMGCVWPSPHLRPPATAASHCLTHQASGMPNEASGPVSGVTKPTLISRPSPLPPPELSLPLPAAGGESAREAAAHAQCRAGQGAHLQEVAARDLAVGHSTACHRTRPAVVLSTHLVLPGCSQCGHVAHIMMHSMGDGATRQESVWRTDGGRGALEADRGTPQAARGPEGRAYPWRAPRRPEQRAVRQVALAQHGARERVFAPAEAARRVPRRSARRRRRRHPGRAWPRRRRPSRTPRGRRRPRSCVSPRARGGARPCRCRCSACTPSASPAARARPRRATAPRAGPCRWPCSAAGSRAPMCATTRSPCTATNWSTKSASPLSSTARSMVSPSSLERSFMNGRMSCRSPP